MEVKLKNIKLSQIYNLLYDLSLKGKQSRHRTKFLNLIQERLQEVMDDEQQIVKEHAHLDEEGNPKKTEDGRHWDIKDIEAFAKDRSELYNEEFVIEGGNYSGILKTVKEILDNLDKELSGEDAEIYDYLCDQFELD